MRRRKPFELDPHLIHHVIHSQAGSIGKALIELIMNAVDAGSPTLDMEVHRTGFMVQDAGKGFQSESEVENYFGRFGTPHAEGDATFGRFRLGRGQIMAHAKTVWESQSWSMTVDTLTMGYAYDLDDLPTPKPGCRITGEWYAPLESYDLHATLQELRDLVRYTPLVVTLNGQVITRSPEAETWDTEDELAYYRLRRDGSMAIYNQGVLVRHDPGHLWGVGGVIVTKKALDLNVSRTEILRKTCAVWQRVERELKRLAKLHMDHEEPHRQSESARSLRARELALADLSSIESFMDDKVFTLLPGVRHLSLRELMRQVQRLGQLTAVPLTAPLVRAENIAQSGIALCVHPRTLERFDCHDPEEFEATFLRIFDVVKARFHHFYAAPAFLPYAVLNDTFVQKTQVIADRQIKDPETRRAWKALKRAIQIYLRTVRRRGPSLHILMGESNTADAWTDGRTYIAIQRQWVEALSGGGLKAAYKILTLVDHELAHEGDSLNAVHDEAFYARYHDISVNYAFQRHEAIQKFLAYYSGALYQHHDRRKRRGWASTHEFHLQRINQLREPMEGQETRHEETPEPELSDTEAALVLSEVNHALRTRGMQPDGRSLEELRAAAEHYERERATQAAAERQAEQTRAQYHDQVQQAFGWLTDYHWYGLTSTPKPDGISETAWQDAQVQVEEWELDFEISRDDWLDREKAHAWVLNFQATHPGETGDPTDILEHEAEQEMAEMAARFEEDLQQEAVWQAEEEAQIFQDHFTAEKLADLKACTGTAGPTPEQIKEFSQFQIEPDEIERFVRSTREWPNHHYDLWLWNSSGKPVLPEDLTWTLAMQLAHNVNMQVGDYLTWRTQKDT